LRESFEQTSILGLRIDVISLEKLIQYAVFMIHHQRKAVSTYVNVHAINIAYKQVWFKDFINHSQIAFCDGVGVKLAAYFIYRKKLQRITPPDWFDRLAGKCAEEGISMFFLGTRQEIVEKVAAKLIKKYPQLIIAGVHHGYFNLYETSLENKEVLANINKARPDILVVGLGMPVQEKWILYNWGDLQVRVILPVGAMFDYLSGKNVRAPRWMTDNGLEWFGRLLNEPGRLWRRYIIGNPLFLWRIFIHHILGFPMPN
jgi:N-acetylglucosaminyldiphosphoundecaprenol N-acetyl-beta-D-mannosaminyltransferase